VTLKVLDTSGLSDTEEASITVKDITPPIARFTVSDDPEEDDDIEFDAAPSQDNVGIDEYLWDFDGSDGLDWEQPDERGMEVSWIYNESGAYKITQYVEDAAGNYDMKSVTVQVLEKEEPEDTGTEGDGDEVVLPGGDENETSSTGDEPKGSSGQRTISLILAAVIICGALVAILLLSRIQKPSQPVPQTYSQPPTYETAPLEPEVLPPEQVQRMDISPTFEPEPIPAPALPQTEILALPPKPEEPMPEDGSTSIDPDTFD